MNAPLSPTPLTRPGAVLAPNLFVDVPGRRLAYRSIGTGRPIVLCTRFRGTMDVWDPAFLDALAAEGLRAITFDYSGLGLSTGTRSYNPLDLARDAHELIEALDLHYGLDEETILFFEPRWTSSVTGHAARCSRPRRCCRR